MEDRIVSFVDFAKTLISITGSEVPKKMQGNIFLGKDKEPSPEYVHLYRDRMGARYDFSRAVTNGKYSFYGILCLIVPEDAHHDTRIQYKPTGVHGKNIMRRVNAMTYSLDFFNPSQL